MTIQQCRAEIDAIDDELLRLTNRRVQLAMTVGELKRDAGLPLYDPKRESDIIAHAQRVNPGALDADSITELFRRIIHITRRIEARHVEAAAADTCLQVQPQEVQR